MRVLITKTFTLFQRVSFIEKDVKIGTITLDDTDSKVTKLWNFYVEEDFRCHGFGFKALTKIIKRTKKDLWLFVYRDNLRAINLYKKAGFQIINDNPFRLTYEMTYKYLDNPEG